MPRSRFRRRRSRRSNRGFKRRFRRRIYGRRRNYRRRGRLPRAIGLAKKVKLTYVDLDTTSITVPAGAPMAYNSYKINSPHDVNNSLGSHTMVGFSEWTRFYGKYICIGAKITMNIMTSGGSGGNFIAFMGMHQNGPGTPPFGSSWVSLMSMRGNANWKFKVIQGSPQRKYTLSLYRPMWKILGNRTEYYGSGNFSAFWDTNPATLFGAWCGFASIGGTSIEGLEVETYVTVTQWIRFYDRKPLFQGLVGATEEDQAEGEDIAPDLV